MADTKDEISEAEAFRRLIATSEEDLPPIPEVPSAFRVEEGPPTTAPAPNVAPSTPLAGPAQEVQEEGSPGSSRERIHVVLQEILSELQALPENIRESLVGED